MASETMWDAILASLPQEEDFAPPATAATVAPDLLARYVGNYSFGPNAVMTVTFTDGQLWASLSKFGFFDLRKGDKSRLTPLSGTDFYIAGRYQTRISFVRDSSGQVTGAVINSGTWAQAGTRNGG